MKKKLRGLYHKVHFMSDQFQTINDTWVVYSNNTNYDI